MNALNGTSKSGFVRGLAIIGALGCLLHWVNLAYVYHYASQTGTDYTLGPDSPVYRGMAEAIARGERLDPMYQERLLVPLILWVLQSVGATHRVFPWLVAILVLPTIMAIGWLAWLLTQRRAVAYAAGILTALYPSAYQYGVLIETDVLHLYLAVVAFVCTVMARETRAAKWFVGAGVFWLLTHLTRPALWGMGLVLPFYWGYALKERLNRRVALVACCGALITPLTFAASNFVRFGIPSPSLHTAEILFVWTRSRIHAVATSEQKGGEWTPLVQGAVADARRDTRWAILHGAYNRTEEFADAYRSVLRESKEYLWRHSRIFLKTTLGEFWHQCSAPFRFYHRYQVPPLEVLYPRGEKTLRVILKLGWWFGLCGWAWAFGGRHRGTAALLLTLAVLNFAPSSLACWIGARIRMPTDILGIPFVMAALTQPLAWAGLTALVGLAYAPRRLGASHDYFLGTSAVLTLAWMAAMNRFGRKQECVRSPADSL